MITYEHEQGWTEKKLQVVLSTIELVSENSFHGVATSAIARHAGVAEGTIFRHFPTKEALIDVAAESAAARVMSRIIKEYDPGLALDVQYREFVHGFLRAGLKNVSCLRYLENYFNSAYGRAYRTAMIKQVLTDPEAARPFFYPLNVILARADKAGLVKPLPLPLLAGLTMGQILFILGDPVSETYRLSDELIETVSRTCWDAIRDHSQST